MKFVKNIKKITLGVLLALTIMNSGFCQNHYIILIDGGAKTRNHENNPALKTLLFDSIPDLLFNKGIRIDDKVIKADINDKFTLAFFGLLSHKKIKHYGDKDYLQTQTLFPALKKVSIKKDYVHKTGVNYSNFKSKQQFKNAINKELRKADTYWYGFATISDYALYEILKNNNRNIQNTIFIVLIKDIEFNGIGAADEFSSIKDHLKNYNESIGTIAKTLSANYQKNEIYRINIDDKISAYFYNLYPKNQVSLTQDFNTDIIDQVIYNDKNSENSLCSISIVLNDSFRTIKNEYKTTIDSIIFFKVKVDEQPVKTHIKNNKINFYFPIPDTLDKCNLPSKKVSLTTYVFLKDSLTGIKKMFFKNPVFHALPPYPTCQIKYWIIRGIFVLLTVLFLIIAYFYYVFRFKKTNLYYQIEKVGNYIRIDRDDSNSEIKLNLDNDTKIWFFFKPSKLKLSKFISKFSHKNIEIIGNDKKYSIADLPVAVELLKGRKIQIKQNNKTILTIKN